MDFLGFPYVYIKTRKKYIETPNKSQYHRTRKCIRDHKNKGGDIVLATFPQRTPQKMPRHDRHIPPQALLNLQKCPWADTTQKKVSEQE